MSGVMGHARSARESAVARLYEEHERAEFPSRLRGEELAGVDLVMLDADIVGCVDAWQGSAGRLDAGRQSILRNCLDDLNRVVPLLTDDREARYYERLRELTRLVLEADR